MRAVQRECDRRCHPLGIAAPYAADRSCRVFFASGYWIEFANNNAPARFMVMIGEILFHSILLTPKVMVQRAVIFGLVIETFFTRACLQSELVEEYRYYELTDEQWEQIEPLPTAQNQKRGD